MKLHKEANNEVEPLKIETLENADGCSVSRWLRAIGNAGSD